MSDKIPNFNEKLGLHILLVSMAAKMLRNETGSPLATVKEVVLYVRSQRPGTLNLLLHEEPLYIAGLMIGASEASVDNLPAEKRAEYHNFYKQITEGTRGRRRGYLKKIWPVLSELSLQEDISPKAYELQLIEPPNVISPETEEPTRRKAPGR